MDRKEAKIWASIPRKKLAVIASHLDKHFDLLCTYANGAEIQLKFRDERDWHTLNSPDFNADEWAEYRVKPSKDEEQPVEPWKPRIGELYFCVAANGEVYDVCFDNDEAENIRIDFGNCFKTRAEAEAALERVRFALKGETLSKSETVESLDGQELSYYEKNLIRLLRNVKIEEVYQFYSVFNKQGGGISFKVDDEECQEEFYQTLTALAEKKPYLPIIG